MESPSTKIKHTFNIPWLFKKCISTYIFFYQWILPSRYIRYGRNKLIIWYSFIVFDLRRSRIPRSARMPRIKRCIQTQFFALCNVIMLLKHVHFLWIIIRTQYHRTRRLFLYLHACCKNVYRSRTNLNIFYF